MSISDLHFYGVRGEAKTLSHHRYSDKCYCSGPLPASIVVLLAIVPTVSKVRVRREAKALSHHRYSDGFYSRLLPTLNNVAFRHCLHVEEGHRSLGIIFDRSREVASHSCNAPIFLLAEATRWWL